jgi:hypothetical protein
MISLMKVQKVIILWHLPTYKNKYNLIKKVYNCCLWKIGRNIKDHKALIMKYEIIKLYKN